MIRLKTRFTLVKMLYLKLFLCFSPLKVSREDNELECGIAGQLTTQDGDYMSQHDIFT